MSDPPALTEEQFRRLCDFLYRRSGMVFTEAKRYYVQRRYGERLAATATATFAAYFALLRSDVGHEIEQFVNAFTINETYFNREDYQLHCLTQDLLADRVQARGTSTTLRIWSVPCSTGEEPYSIAIWLLENWPDVDRHEIEIVASDIDTAVLEKARTGNYGRRALARLSQPVIAKYFTQVTDDDWTIIDDLRDSIRFSQVNLIEAAETRRAGQFDIIFCRNVLLYFDDVARRIAAENLYEALLPGGYICLGHTESMSRISPLFTVRRFADAIVYQRGSDHAR